MTSLTHTPYGWTGWTRQGYAVRRGTYQSIRERRSDACGAAFETGFASREAASRLRLEAMATVGEVMNRDLITVDPSATVAEAATVMGGKHVGSALVMDGDQLTGIFTERDIVRALGEHFDAAGHPVSHWMTSNPQTIAPGAPTEQALDAMLKGGFRHLPVVDGDRVVGMLSLRDVAASD